MYRRKMECRKKRGVDNRLPAFENVVVLRFVSDNKRYFHRLVFYHKRGKRRYSNDSEENHFFLLRLGLHDLSSFFMLHFSLCLSVCACVYDSRTNRLLTYRHPERTNLCQCDVFPHKKTGDEESS